MIRLIDILNEVLITDPKHQVILRDSDTIRVYHGFYDFNNAIEFCKQGVSGKELASRVYSYESNNNPYGLFVSAKFSVSKEFCNNVGGVGAIIEFQTKVSDLEAPVWPDGGYTVQGGYSSYWNGEQWKDKMANREQGRLDLRNKIMTSPNKDIDFIKRSDRPELAMSLLYSGEYQALFMGDLNPNMIRAVWVMEGNMSAKYGNFKRMSVREFLHKYEKSYSKKKDKYDKVYKPTESWNGVHDYLERFAKCRGYEKDIIDDIERSMPEDLKRKNGKAMWLFQLENDLWPKQLKQAIEDLALDDDYYMP